MILETITRGILHCSRCNNPFLDYETDLPTLWGGEQEIEDCFPKQHPFRDAGGWRRIGDRYLCEDCHGLDCDGMPVEHPLLPAADADKVTRAQLRYQQTARFTKQSRRGMTTAELLEVLDDIRTRVAAGDSFEGFVEYLIPEGPDSDQMFDVRAGYRIGNSMGQGGFRVIQCSNEEVSV